MIRWLVLGQLLALPFMVTAGELSGTVEFSGETGEPPPPIVVYLESKGDKPIPPPESKPMLSQKNAQFSPGLLVVAAGQTVNMPNDDAIAHNVFSYSKAKQFNLGIYPKGDSRDVTFEKPGRVDIYCSIHRHMHAIILVVPTPYFHTTTPGKAYSLKDIPEGEYTLAAWMDGAKKSSLDISIKDGSTQHLDLKLEPIDPENPENPEG